MPNKQQVSFVTRLPSALPAKPKVAAATVDGSGAEGSVALSIATRSMVADRRYSGTIYKMALVDRFRLRSVENFFESGVASELVPLPAQTQFGLRDAPVIKAGSRGRTRGPQEAFNQREGLICLARERINQSQLVRALHTLDGVCAFRTEFNRSATFANGVLFPAHVAVEYSESTMVPGRRGMIAHIAFQGRSHFFKKGSRQFHIATRQCGLGLIETFWTSTRKFVRREVGQPLLRRGEVSFQHT